jgi:hypothetical protein
VLLTREEDGRRLWIEFEISRADPVANHAKFATAHLFQPWTENDTFVSMVSPHVTRGRRNLAANTITLMRHVGIQAFQTPLFPFLDGGAIKRLNHMPLDDLASETLDVRRELDRVLAVSQPVIVANTHRIHFAANLTDVMLNVHQWHLDMSNPLLLEQWGKRTITYFIYDPRTHRFAPSKFCAFLSSDRWLYLKQMRIEEYVTYDESEPRFDGHIARRHLERHLAMHEEVAELASAITQHFERWLDGVHDAVRVHPRGPKFLVPPRWFA